MNKTIVFLLLSYLVCGFGHDYYMDRINLLNLSGSESMVLLFIGMGRTISLYASFFLLALSLSIAKRNFPSKANIIGYMACIFVGFSYCIGMTYLNSIVSDVDSEQPSILKSDPNFLTTYEIYLDSERAFDKESLSVNKQMASTLFIDEGLVVDTIDENGSRVKYVPTEEDKEMRSSLVRAYELLAWSKSAMKESIVQCWSFLLFTLLVSYYYKHVLTAYNKLFKRDGDLTR